FPTRRSSDLATLGGYLLSLKVGLFGFTEVRTTAGIIAAIIDVAIFAVLAAGMISGLGLGRRLLPAVGAVSAIALALTIAFVASPTTPAPVATGGGGGGQTLDARTIGGKALLTDAKGLTLYTFAPDKVNKSVCYGDCASYWPPVPGNMSAGPGVTGKIGTITRTDGTTQATYNGRPLYTYIGDHGPGTAAGNNINLNGGLWLDVPVGSGRPFTFRAWPRMSRVSEPFPSPTIPADSRTEVFLRYMDFFRSPVTAKMHALHDAELRSSRLPAGWTPLELVKHLRYVELRWLVGGFEGRDVGDPWGDRDGDRWAVGPQETPATLLADLHAQGTRSRAIIEAHRLDEVGQPGERWDGADPATLERVLFHLLQEYARHVGHLDIVTELATGVSEE